MLDLRFADDILTFGIDSDSHVVGVLVGKFVENPAPLGLQLDVLRKESAQSRPDHRRNIAKSSHKLLGWMVGTCTSHNI